MEQFTLYDCARPVPWYLMTTEPAAKLAHRLHPPDPADGALDWLDVPVLSAKAEYIVKVSRHLEAESAERSIDLADLGAHTSDHAPCGHLTEFGQIVPKGAAQTCLCGLSGRIDSRCESAAIRVEQQRP